MPSATRALRVATDARGWLYPANEADVVEVVRQARAQRQRVRVRGASHSVPAAIAGDGDTVLVLDRLRDLRFDEVTGEVTAGAGMRLGDDPLDPSRGASPTLCAWLHARGRALPNLGGVIHQTVFGFLATGSGGGSTRYDAATAVTGLRLVDGTGHVHSFRRGTHDDQIAAVLSSVGVMGIVTEVTFCTEAAFDVAGRETVWPDRGGALDLFVDGDRGLAAFLEQHDYARILWWPQPAVRRIVAWTADRIIEHDPRPARPYHPMPLVLGSSQPAQIAGGAALWGIVHWRQLAARVGATMPQRLERLAAPVIGALYRAFVDGDPDRPQEFRGAWWEILPQDTVMDERWMPTTFTEIFVPLEAAGDAMRRLDRLFADDPETAGHFAFELYAAPASTSWMHPAAGQPSLRINVFWLMHEPRDPRDTFLPRIWEALAPLRPRLHWGKLFPHEPATMVRDRFPRLAEFRAMREQMDPDAVFLTEWMASALDVPGAPARPKAPLPQSGTRQASQARRAPQREL